MANAYAFNPDRSKAPVYTKAEIDQMDLVNDQALAQEAASRAAEDIVLGNQIANIVAPTPYPDGTTVDELIDIRSMANGSTAQSAGDAVRAMDSFLLHNTGYMSLLGPDPYVYYPVPKLNVGDKLTVSTYDSSTFTGKTITWLRDDFTVIGSTTFGSNYGNSRTLTIDAAAAQAAYFYTNSDVPLMVNLGTVALPYSYKPNQLDILYNVIQPVELSSNYLNDHFKQWYGVWHSANATHSSLLDIVRVNVKAGEVLHVIASIDGSTTGKGTMYATLADGTSTSLGSFDLDVEKAWTATGDVVGVSAYWSTGSPMTAVADINVHAWVDYADPKLVSLNNSEKQIVYVANKSIYNNVSVEEGISGGKVAITFNDQLMIRCAGNTLENTWATITSNLSSGDYTIDGSKCTITMSYSKLLVYNIDDQKLYIRQYGTKVYGDIILAKTQYGLVCGGYVFDWMHEARIKALEDTGGVTSSTLLAQAFNSSYHVGATDFADKCTEFSSLMYGDATAGILAPIDCESFLFFTDPHLCQSSGWESKCYEYVSQIQKYYNSTPTSFCVCGGDWLGNSDLPEEACFKLGYIDGFMHSMFGNCYMLVGNHDTNYQGKLTPESSTYTTRLSDQSIKNLWYRDGKAYYEFMGANTRFFCFDTGTENQALTTFDDYGYEQAQWFADSLMTNTDEHIALLAHILYPLTIGTLQPLTALLLQISEAFNTRSSIVVNNETYNFANASGKVEFGLFGHSHADGEYEHNGIPCIMTTNVRHNESVGPSFDLMFVNYDEGKIYMIRVGDGSDREVSI